MRLNTLRELLDWEGTVTLRVAANASATSSGAKNLSARS
jgi:hypothetical protein